MPCEMPFAKETHVAPNKYFTRALALWKREIKGSESKPKCVLHYKVQPNQHATYPYPTMPPTLCRMT